VGRSSNTERDDTADVEGHGKEEVEGLVGVPFESLIDGSDRTRERSSPNGGFGIKPFT